VGLFDLVLPVLLLFFLMILPFLIGFVERLLLRIVAIYHIYGFPSEILLINATVRVFKELVSLTCPHEEDPDLLFRELVLR